MSSFGFHSSGTSLNSCIARSVSSQSLISITSFLSTKSQATSLSSIITFLASISQAAQILILLCFVLTVAHDRSVWRNLVLAISFLSNSSNSPSFSPQSSSTTLCLSFLFFLLFLLVFSSSPFLFLLFCSAIFAFSIALCSMTVRPSIQLLSSISLAGFLVVSSGSKVSLVKPDLL